MSETTQNKQWRILLAREKANIINQIAGYIGADIKLDAMSIVDEKTLYKIAKVIENHTAEKSSSFGALKDMPNYFMESKNKSFHIYSLLGNDDAVYLAECYDDYKEMLKKINKLFFLIETVNKKEDIKIAEAKNTYYTYLADSLSIARLIEQFPVTYDFTTEQLTAIRTNKLYLNRFLEIEANRLFKLSAKMHSSVPRKSLLKIEGINKEHPQYNEMLAMDKEKLLNVLGLIKEDIAYKPDAKRNREIAQSIKGEIHISDDAYEVGFCNSLTGGYIKILEQEKRTLVEQLERVNEKAIRDAQAKAGKTNEVENAAFGLDTEKSTKKIVKK